MNIKGRKNSLPNTINQNKNYSNYKNDKNDHGNLNNESLNTNSNVNLLNNDELANSEKLRIYLANKEKNKKEMKKNKIMYQNANQFQNINLKSEKNLIGLKQENFKDEKHLLENSKNPKPEWDNDYCNFSKNYKKGSLKISKYDSSNRTANNLINRKYDNKKCFNNDYESSEKKLKSQNRSGNNDTINSQLHKNYKIKNNQNHLKPKISTRDNSDNTKTTNNTSIEGKNYSNKHLENEDIFKENLENITKFSQENKKLNKSSSMIHQISFNKSKSFFAIEEMSSNGTNNENNFNDL